MKGASRRGPSQNRQYKAGRRRGRILLPAERSPAPNRAGSASNRQVEQLVRRSMDGEVDVTGGLRQHIDDGPDWCPDPRPSHPLRRVQVTAGDGVGDVRLGWHTPEVREPFRERRSGPEGCEDAVDCLVASVALGQGPLAGDVVDERQPAGREVAAQRHQRQHLRQNLKDVDEGAPGREEVEEVRWGRATVVEHRRADAHHEAPAVGSFRSRLDRHLRREVAGFIPGLARLVEGVRVDDGLWLAVVDVGDHPRLDVRQERLKRHEGCPQAGRQASGGRRRRVVGP